MKSLTQQAPEAKNKTSNPPNPLQSNFLLHFLTFNSSALPVSEVHGSSSPYLCIVKENDASFFAPLSG